MECFQTKSFNCKYEADGSGYRCSIDNAFTFAVEFIGNPAVAVSTVNSEEYAYASVYATVRDNKGISYLSLVRPKAFTAGELGKTPVSYIAKGRWK